MLAGARRTIWRDLGIAVAVVILSSIVLMQGLALGGNGNNFDHAYQGITDVLRSHPRR